MNDAFLKLVVIIEKIRAFKDPLHLDQLLLTREAYWTNTIVRVKSTCTTKHVIFTPLLLQLQLIRPLIFHISWDC